jgi:tripeptide aminopeptidase
LRLKDDIMINTTRICEEFMHQAAIDSPSFKEGEISAYLKQRFENLGAEVIYDNAGEKVGSQSGNMIARIQGTKAGAPLLLSGHMDTVTPAQNVEPVLIDGVFTSAGDTILGADDKAGLVEIIEAIEVLREQQIPHVPLEIAITIGEEQGLLGAKALDFSLLTAKRGIALDTTGTDIIIHKAPAAKRFRIDIFGHEAHAGFCPEEGISAIRIASSAIAKMPLGRIDEETTANIGTIHGGLAANIIPNCVRLTGEVRSHNQEKLARYTKEILSPIEDEVAAATIQVKGETRRASLELKIHDDYPAMHVDPEAEIVQVISRAGAALKRPQQILAAGGGSDANIFNANGIETVILACGMDRVHSIDEQVAVEDMVKTAALLVEIIRRA